jgi:hypothetical protein
MNDEELTNIELAEQTIKEFLAESKKDLSMLSELAEEMDYDPNLIKTKIELTNKASNLVDKLLSIERLKNNKMGSATNNTFNMEGAVFVNTASLLSKIESDHYGLNTRETLYAEPEVDYVEVVENTGE